MAFAQRTPERIDSADSLGNPQAYNRYTYVLNNPVRYTDPSGHAIPIDVDANLLWSPQDNAMVRDVGGSGLLQVIAQAGVGGASAATRLNSILKATQGSGITNWSWADRLAGGATRTHFRGSGAIRNDAGFAPEFKDDYLYAELWDLQTPYSRQTGHFLTAVDMGLQGAWVHSIVGHEQSSDSLKHGSVFTQMLQPRHLDKQLFRSAVALDEAGYSVTRDRTLAYILRVGSEGMADRQGNSLEDLRLSVRGWRLGSMVAGGQIQSNKELANWLALNVAGE